VAATVDAAIGHSRMADASASSGVGAQQGRRRREMPSSTYTTLARQREPESEMWDVFVSYASEDRGSIVEPLVRELERYCLKIWFDQWALSPGDSLRAKIDDGLANSQLGVVVLSQAFFRKRWPQAELDALHALALASNRALVPIWHNITYVDVAAQSPLLAGVLAIPSQEGVLAIARRLSLKCGCKGGSLEISLDSSTHKIVPDVDTLAAAISESEHIPGSYAKRRITLACTSPRTRYAHEIERGVRLLVTLQSLTFPIRYGDLLARCVSEYARLYDVNGRSWSADGERIDLWRDNPSWYIGIYLSDDETRHVCEITGVPSLAWLRGEPQPMISLGTSVLARKAIPKLLWEFFREEQRTSSDYSTKAAELLSLASWAFGPG
jgi:hypothetical protein